MAYAALRLKIGDRFGRLEVIGEETKVGTPGTIRSAYPCRCDCSTELIVKVSKLQSGTKSCGCARGEKPGNRSKSIKIGDRFGRLEVIGPYTMIEEDGRRAAYPCRCKCGTELVVSARQLQGGASTSCGCNREWHGLSGSRLHSIWTQMKDRCNRREHPRYKDYGGRGIRICDEWMSLAKFSEWANANGYRDDLTIERKAVDGDYCPKNCTWITIEEQQANRRNTRFLTAFGETKRLVEWAEDQRCSVDYFTLYARVLHLGWSPEEALTTPKLFRSIPTT